MRAVRLYDTKDLRFEDVDLPTAVASGTVRVRVSYAGICGSDIHNYTTGQWISRRPSTAGHELSGVVETLGGGVTSLSVGDKVVADSRHYCGGCANCRSGLNHLCDTLGFIGEAIDGGFADYVDLPERLVHRCPNDMEMDVAALAEPLAVALHALRLLTLGDDPLLIVGCGPIGALAATVSKLTSKRDLFVCDQNDDRAALVSKETGATSVTLKDLESLSKNALRPVRSVLDTTGSVHVIKEILEHLSGGVLGLVGIGSGTLDFDPVHAVEREITIVGCHAFSNELPQAVELLAKNPSKFAPLVQHRIALEQTPSEYEKIVKGNPSGIKTLIDIRSGARG